MIKLNRARTVGCHFLILSTMLSAQAKAPTAAEWNELLRLAANPAFYDAAEAKIRELSPTFTSAEPSYLRNVLVPLLLPELASPEERRRLNASGLLSTMSMLRPDTAVILKGHSTAIGKTLRLGKDRPTYNCILALARMKPVMEVEAAEVLTEWLKTALREPASEDSVVTAAFGVARCSACAGAGELVVQVLDKTYDTHAGRQLVKAIGGSGIGDKAIIGWILHKTRQGSQELRLVAISATAQLARRDDVAITTVRDIAGNLEEPVEIRKAAQDALRRMEN